MRKRGCFWVLFLSAGLLTLFVGSLYFLIRGLEIAAPSIEEGSVLTIDLARSFPEDTVYDISSQFWDSPKLTFRDLIFGIRAAEKDDRIDQVLLHVRGAQLGWAQAEGLRNRLSAFRDAGKRVVAFVEFGSNVDFYVASIADEVYLHPQGMLDLRGISAEVTFMKGTLDKLGVEAEFERFGAYKSAPETFLRESMSPEQREVLGAMVGSVHDTLVAALSVGRGLSLADAEGVLSEGPLIAEKALNMGLVDGLLYLDEVKAGLIEAGADSESDAEEPESVDLNGYRLALRQAPDLGAKGELALIYGLGAIVPGGSGEDALFGRVMGADTIAEAFRKAREDDSIDAVVFRIDSPGGSDVASDIIWREANLTREEKPVIVSMGSVAASGGYWIAMASDAIVAEPTTITGSIGIFAGKFNLNGLYEKIGLHRESVASNANADFFSDSRSFTPEERLRLREILENGYQHFLEKVAESRGKTVEQVHDVAQGRVWMGSQALEHGLVDEMGGLERAIDLAKEKAGFDPDDRMGIRIYPEKQTLLDAILSSLAVRTSPVSPAMEAARWIAPDLHGLAARSPLLQLLLQGQTLALMPYDLHLQ